MTTDFKKSMIKVIYDYKVDIIDICKEFLIKHQLAFFGYLRCYEDSRCYVLSTHPSVYDYLLHTELPLTAPVSADLLKNRKIYYLVPDHTIYGKVLQDVSIQFNLYYPLDLIFRHSNYYEMFCYGIDKNDFNKISYYLNNLTEFEQFANFFKERAQSIIKRISNTRILLPDTMFKPVKHFIMPTNESNKLNSKIALTDKNKYSVSINNMNVILTKREFDCLNCLLEGKTAQETAEKLFISRRTVESYLEIIKQKTFSRNKFDLTAKIRDLYS